MHRLSHRLRVFPTTVALVASVALGVAPAAFGDDRAAPSQSAAIGHLVRQEDAGKAELARYDAIARQNDLSTMLDARERAMAARPETAASAPVRDDRFRLDPAIRTAMVARASAAAATTSVVAPASAGDGGFAWGAAALGLGAGIVAMCALLACVTLVRSHGRLRSA